MNLNFEQRLALHTKLFRASRVPEFGHQAMMVMACLETARAEEDGDLSRPCACDGGMLLAAPGFRELCARFDETLDCAYEYGLSMPRGDRAAGDAFYRSSNELLASLAMLLPGIAVVWPHVSQALRAQARLGVKVHYGKAADQMRLAENLAHQARLAINRAVIAANTRLH